MLLQECPQLFQNSSSSSSSTAFGTAGSCTSGWSPYSYEEEAAAQEAAAAGTVSAAGAVAEAPCTSVYEVGRTLLFFHSLGWSHSSVMRRIIGLYPQVCLEDGGFLTSWGEGGGSEQVTAVAGTTKAAL